MRYNVTGWGAADSYGPAWQESRVFNQAQLDEAKVVFEAIFGKSVLKYEGTDGSCLYETPNGLNGFEAIPIDEAA